MNVTITWEGNKAGCGTLIARNAEGDVVDHLPGGDPINASSDSWAIARDVLGDRRILSVDHDKDVVMAEVADK